MKQKLKHIANRQEETKIVAAFFDVRFFVVVVVHKSGGAPRAEPSHSYALRRKKNPHNTYINITEIKWLHSAISMGSVWYHA